MRALAGLLSLGVHFAAAIQDSTLLIQAGHGSGVPLFVHSTRPRFETHKFPLQRGHFHFVASAAFKLSVVGMRIHCYDVAMYAERNSTVWKNAKVKDGALDRVLGESYFAIVAQSSFVSRKVMAGFVDRLPFFAKELGITESLDSTLAKYKQLYLDGPKVRVGSEIIIMPNRTAVTPFVDGRSSGTCESSWLGRTIVEAYLGRHCDLPEFRNRALAQLAEGLPDIVTEPAIVSANFHVPWWVVLLIAVGITGVLGCLVGLGWYSAKKWSRWGSAS